jgi:dethiobiotin synthetase
MTKKCGYFITGTDTGVGKTLMSSALLYALAQCNIRAAGMKPVSAGAVLRDGYWHNDDTDSLAAASNVRIPVELLTPYLLREAAAPHIAAALEGVHIDPAHLHACYNALTGLADAIVVEGVGGFCVPLSNQFDTVDLAQQLQLPVIMVVGMRLGCLNHALLTAEAMAARGLTLAGWIANAVDIGMPHLSANIDALATRLRAPLLGYVPQLAQPSADLAAAHLDFTCLPGWPGAPANLP